MRFIPLLPFVALVLAACESALAVDTALVLNAPKLSLPDDCLSRTQEECGKKDECIWHDNEFSDSTGGSRHHFCTVQCYGLNKELCEGREGCSWFSKEKCVNSRFTRVYRRFPVSSTNVAPWNGLQYSGMESEILGEASTRKRVMPLLATNEGTEWFMPGPSSPGKRTHTSNVADQGESSTRKKVCTGKVPDETTTSTNVRQFMPTNDPDTLAPQRLPERLLSLGISADCTVEELEQLGEGSEEIDCSLRL